MNCQEALDLLYDIIDQEASEIDEQQVHEHLKNCSDCSGIYRVEQSINAFLKAKISSDSPTPSLENLKSSIKEQMDCIDKEKTVGPRPRFFRYTVVALAAAASLVVLLGAAWFTSDYVNHYRTFGPIQRAHFAIGEIDNPHSDNLTLVATTKAVEQQLGYRVEQTVSGFSLVAGHFETVMDVEMAHFVYARDGKVVSVFVAPSDEYEMPEDMLKSCVNGDNTQLWDHSCKRCRLVYHRSDRAVVITATNDKTVELLEFIPGSAVI